MRLRHRARASPATMTKFTNGTTLAGGGPIIRIGSAATIPPGGATTMTAMYGDPPHGGGKTIQNGFATITPSGGETGTTTMRGNPRTGGGSTERTGFATITQSGGGLTMDPCGIRHHGG